ncbi:hypothetical protein GBAR_LOCUS4485 [Geodia barretti]|uniref:Uncharacterized protein n=1 Tax=Geodia barretti TaxID=519541 RepID=A0AA35R6X7_GEOBA|nr:hypothetical protein GBAR_LOCUS4485 [Geodia barretti]
MLTQALFIPHGLPHYCANTAGSIYSGVLPRLCNGLCP